MQEQEDHLGQCFPRWNACGQAWGAGRKLYLLFIALLSLTFSLWGSMVHNHINILYIHIGTHVQNFSQWGALGKSRLPTPSFPRLDQ